MSKARRTDSRTLLADHDGERLSRPTSAAMSGKQTCVLKTLVTDEVSEDFGRFARERGYGAVSDCLRELVLIACYGSEFVTDLHRRRIESLSRKKDEISTVGG